MLEKIKGFRTYGTLVVLFVLGALVNLQTSCVTNPSELGALCGVISGAWVGKAIMVLTAIAAWFRKLANTDK